MSVYINIYGEVLSMEASQNHGCFNTKMVQFWMLWGISDTDTSWPPGGRTLKASSLRSCDL